MSWGTYKHKTKKPVYNILRIFVYYSRCLKSFVENHGKI